MRTRNWIALGLLALLLLGGCSAQSPATEADPGAPDARGTVEARNALQIQLTYLRSEPEPDAAVPDGVYLARITAPDAGRSEIVADWESTDGVVFGKVSNESDFAQPVTLQPMAMVWTQRPEAGAWPTGTVPQPARMQQFFGALSSDDATGTAMRDAHWWVTIVGGQCAQLVEAPAAR